MSLPGAVLRTLIDMLAIIAVVGYVVGAAFMTALLIERYGAVALLIAALFGFAPPLLFVVLFMNFYGGGVGEPKRRT